MANTTRTHGSNGASNGSAAAERPRRSDSARRRAASWSPFTSSSSHDEAEESYWLDREITLLERALRDQGEMRRGDLGELIGCKYWGPGRFAGALRAAVEQGRIKRVGFGRYAPASS